jgi:hypothetical protein
MFTEDHKKLRMDVSSQLLRLLAGEGDDFLFNIVTGDESWFHRFDPETKRQFMDWHHTTSIKKNCRTAPSVVEFMGTATWDAEGCILLDFSPNGESISAVRYVQTLRKLKETTYSLTSEKIAKKGWEMLPQTPYEGVSKSFRTES